MDFRHIAGCILLIVSIPVIYVNSRVIIRARILRCAKRHESLVPFIGGAFGSLGVWMLFGGTHWVWILLPSVLDIGSFPYAIVFACYFLRR